MLSNVRHALRQDYSVLLDFTDVKDIPLHFIPRLVRELGKDFSAQQLQVLLTFRGLPSRDQDKFHRELCGLKKRKRHPAACNKVDADQTRK